MRRCRSLAATAAAFMLVVATLVASGVTAPAAGAATVSAPGAISLGDTVSGNISVATESDQYTLSLAAGARAAYFEPTGNVCNCTWSLSGAQGTVFSQSLATGDVGPTALSTGTYVLTLSGTGTSTGTYSFNVSAVPNPQSFTISFGDTVSSGVPSAGAGNIESPGANDQYTFTVGGSGQLVYLRYFYNNCGCSWSLRASSGSLEHGFGVQGISDVGPTWLPADSYVLTVSGSGHATGTYSFQLSAAPAPQTFPISIGDTVAQDNPNTGAGNIESPGAIDQYTFTVGGSGESVYLQDLGDGCGCTWTLKSSSGSLEHGFAAQGISDVGSTWLPPDSYVLTVAGSGNDTGTYSFQLSAVPDPQSFPISIGDTVSQDTPSSGAGNIASPGAIQQYTFTLASDQRISLQELGDNCGCSWSLRSSTGSLAYGFAEQGIANVGPTWLPAGSYVLTVSGSGHDTGTYSFQLSAVPDPQTFPISIGDTVSQNTPALGAGDIEAVGATDQYTFNATAGSRLAIVGISCDVSMSYVLSAPDGRQLVRNQLCSADDILDLPNQTGQYLVTVNAASGNVGAYSFQIASTASATNITLPDADVFPISIGDSVSPGTPSAGAGDIESAGSVDDYVFSASAGQTLRFNDPLTAPCCSLVWQVFGPDGTQLASSDFSASYGQQFTLAESGVFEIEVSSATTGTYSFSLTQVANSQTFPISIGDTIGPDTPLAGEGNIEQPGSDDEYAFNGTAGQVVRFNDLGVTSTGSLYWQVYAPDGSTIAQNWLGSTYGQQFVLPTTGQYTIRVNDYYYYGYYGYYYATGTYSFSLTQVPAAQTFGISIGDTIGPDTPVTGEGNIEQPGSDDEYAFNGTAGETVRFNDLDLNTFPSGTIYWQVYAPDGTALAQNWLGESTGQQFVLPATGQYTIRVNDYYDYYYGYYSDNATGTYSFSLTQVPAAQPFAIAIGDTIGPDTPLAGEGNIEQPGSDDEYAFGGTAGQTVRFNDLDLNTFPSGTVYWTVFAPDGTALAQNWLGDTTGQQFVLPATGQYTIRVYDYYAYSGNSDSTVTGTYNFSLTLVPLLVPAVTAPIATALSSGQNAVWTIGVQNTSSSPLQGVSATLHAAANGSTPLGFDTADMPGCSAQSDLSEVCALADIPAHSTEFLTVFVPTTGLSTGTAVTGDVNVSATGVANAAGLLDTVTITSCGVGCVFAAAAPGVAVSSNPNAPTGALPTKQVLLLPANQTGGPVEPAIPVTLKSVNPGSATSASDRTLCPTTGTQPRCTGQISVFAGNFTKYANRGRPVQIQVLAHWTKTPTGALLMSDDNGSPPIQLPACVLNATTHQYNTPCAKPETKTGSLAAGNLITHDTILFVGTDPHFARRLTLPIPNAPTSVKATAGTKRATVSWVKPTVTHTTLKGYVVTAYVGTVAKKTVSFTSIATTEAITGLVTGTTYTFKVQARNAYGLSYMSVASSPVKVK